MGNLLEEHEKHLATVEHREQLLAKREQEVKQAMNDTKIEQEKQMITSKNLDERVKKAKEREDEDLFKTKSKLAEKVEESSKVLQ
jgi:hypothetical protein